MDKDFQDLILKATRHIEEYFQEYLLFVCPKGVRVTEDIQVGGLLFTKDLTLQECQLLVPTFADTMKAKDDYVKWSIMYPAKGYHTPLAKPLTERIFTSDTFDWWMVIGKTMCNEEGAGKGPYMLYNGNMGVGKPYATLLGSLFAKSI